MLKSTEISDPLANKKIYLPICNISIDTRFPNSPYIENKRKAKKIFCSQYMTNPDKAFIVVLFLLVHCLRWSTTNYYHSLRLIYFQNVIKFFHIVTANAHFFIQANGIVIFVWLFSVLFALFPLLGWNSYVSEVSFHNLYAMIKSTTFMNLIVRWFILRFKLY